MSEYQLVTYQIIWYAELGYVDGDGMGRWEKTTYSKPFPTKDEAIACLVDHPGTVPEDRHWGTLPVKNPHPYGEMRVRRAEVQVVQQLGPCEKCGFEKIDPETERMMGL